MDIESSEIKERMISLAESLNISARDFSKKIGKDPSYIKGIKKEISTDVLRNIYLNFPEINIMWIITGNGEKFLSNFQEHKNNENLTDHLKEEIKELREENKSLYKEIGKLEGINQELKKQIVLMEKNAKCAAVSGSDLVR